MAERTGSPQRETNHLAGVLRGTVGALAGAVCRVMTWITGGRGRMPRFPKQPVQRPHQRLAYDLNDDKRDDYWQDVGANGQKLVLRFDNNGDGQPDESIRLDKPPPANALHVIIFLDGVPFDLIQDLHAAGRFRLFPPPSRLTSVFPAMTDLALARAFSVGPCLGYEALYFDVRRNRLSHGNQVYLSGCNAPWTSKMDYRCRINWDAVMYLNPPAVWRHELDGFACTIQSAENGPVCLYTVATSGLGMRGGGDAIREFLETIDDLCEQVTHQRQGKVRFTLLADHGIGGTPSQRISFRPLLTEAGLRMSKSVDDDSEVVIPEYGLVTCAVAHTRKPERVADVILKHEATDLVMYPAARPRDDQVVLPGASGGGNAPAPIIVRNSTARAEIHRRGARFVYRAVAGDPLKLTPVLDRLTAEGKAAPDGSASDDDWFEATTAHDYPDPLHRIWCAFEQSCLVENPADVIVSLKEGYACGSKLFSMMINIAGTHGSLAQQSNTFIMSNAVPLPPVLRVDDVIRALNAAKTPATAARRSELRDMPRQSEPLLSQTRP